MRKALLAALSLLVLVPGAASAADDGQQAHASDLAALEGLAERFGFPTGTGAADQIFREPDSLRKALT